MSALPVNTHHHTGFSAFSLLASGSAATATAAAIPHKSVSADSQLTGITYQDVQISPYTLCPFQTTN
jgi:hypothetical protein